MRFLNSMAEYGDELGYILIKKQFTFFCWPQHLLRLEHVVPQLIWQRAISYAVL